MHETRAEKPTNGPEGNSCGALEAEDSASWGGSSPLDGYSRGATTIALSRAWWQNSTIGFYSCVVKGRIKCG